VVGERQKNKKLKVRKTNFNMTTFFINSLGLGLVFSSILSISATNPVISVIFLISTFICSAGYLILIGVKFIGISYIVIYVGAIAVLFLFVIMMININIKDIVDTGYNYTQNFPLSILIISLFIFIFKDIIFYIASLIPSINNLSYYALDIFNSQHMINIYDILYFSNKDKLSLLDLTYIDSFFTQFEQISILGHVLYTYGAILFILLSVILLLAMLATIVISKENNNKI
jgi:NADH-ubiquinone oxidoreductase chain 6